MLSFSFLFFSSSNSPKKQNYDIYGPWASTAGPNAPLRSACDTRNTQGSGELGINAWLAAGIPADKLVLGIAAYGHGFRVNATSATASTNSSSTTTSDQLNMFPAFNASDRFRGSSWDSDPPVDDCGNAQPPGGTYQFWSMITEAGFLDESGNPREGILYGYDECSQTVRFFLLCVCVCTHVEFLTDNMISLLSTTPRVRFGSRTIMLSLSLPRVNTSWTLASRALLCGRLAVITTTSWPTASGSHLACNDAVFESLELDGF